MLAQDRCRAPPVAVFREQISWRVRGSQARARQPPLPTFARHATNRRLRPERRHFGTYVMLALPQPVGGQRVEVPIAPDRI